MGNHVPATPLLLTSLQNPNASITSQAVPADAKNIQITCQTLPFGVSYFVALTPLDTTALLQLIPDPNVIAATTWNGKIATSFVDRLVLHPDAYPSLAPLPVQMLLPCQLTQSGNTIQCALPVSIRGNLLRMNIGWGNIVDNTSLALPLSVTFPPLPPFVGTTPMILSFPVPQIAYHSVQRFQENKVVYPFTRDPKVLPALFNPKSCSYFDGTLNTTVSNQQFGSQLSLLPVSQPIENLYMTGSMFLAQNLSNLQVFLSYEI
jgi:hypothetical protein